MEESPSDDSLTDEEDQYVSENSMKSGAKNSKPGIEALIGTGLATGNIRMSRKT